MKKFITPTYTFTPGASGVGTVNLSGITGFNIKNLISIINQTRGIVIYSTASVDLRYTNVSGTTVTLNFDTSTQNAADVLQVIYEEQGQKASASSDSVVLSSDQPAIPVKGSLTALPIQTSEYLPVRVAPALKFRTTFASAITNSVDSNFFTLLQTGSGQTINQTGGNLVLTTGTTANSETIIRSTQSFADALICRYTLIASQRIINQNLFVELVDVIGDSLAITVNSATSITVTIPSNPFTSVNVGQSVHVGNFSGISGAISGRYAIASVSGNNVTFTVAGFPVSGSGTCSVWGWNYSQVVYNGTGATSVNYDTQRRGYNSGFTAAAINTTASPGHMGIMTLEDGVAAYLDQLVASNTALQTTMRASRVQNIPEQTANLFLQIRSLNGSTAPASTTTFTIGMCHVENYTSMPVSINQVKAQAFNSAQPISVVNTPAVTVSSGTVTTVTTVNTVAAVTAANLALPGSITDVASAALTTTTTTAAFTPTFGTSYVVTIPVTVVTGTTPTLDVGIEVSDDSGTNWFRVYDFPRITTTGIYRSPQLAFSGNRVRYVQTVGGTTPSFTRAVLRLQTSVPGVELKSFIDRTINLNTLNSTTPSYFVEGSVNFNIYSRVTAQTTAATLTLQFSDDNVNWHTTANTLTSVVGFAHTKVSNEQWKFARLIVSAAGTGITLAEVAVKALRN